MGHMSLNLPIVYFIGGLGGKVLGSLIKLDMKDCSSSRVISNFGLVTAVVCDGVGNRNDISVGTLMGGKAISSTLLSNLSLDFFLDRGIHPLMTICIVHMIDEDGVGDICFRNIYI